MHTSYHSQKKLNPKYAEPIGYWEVTTEGDCEGRSTRNLGTHFGHIADIALALADKCYYSLTFKKPKEATPLDLIPTGDNVHIKFDIDSGTWDMDKKIREKAFEKILESQPSKTKIVVDESNYFGSVRLLNTELEATKRKKKEIALAKLTGEEQKLLGLI